MLQDPYIQTWEVSAQEVTNFVEILLSVVANPIKMLELPRSILLNGRFIRSLRPGMYL